MKRLIWTSRPDNLEDMKKAFLEDHPELDDIEDDALYEINDELLQDERKNLDIELACPILAIANLGLWNGRFPAYKELGNNIKDCLYSDYEPTWYVDDQTGDFCCDEAHHDGVNHIIYRQIKSTASPKAVAALRAKIYWGSVTRADINRVTKRLGDEIGQVYGWECKQNGKKSSVKEATVNA